MQVVHDSSDHNRNLMQEIPGELVPETVGLINPCFHHYPPQYYCINVILHYCYSIV